MKAVQVHEAGGPEKLVLGECQKPEYGLDDVLVEVKAIGINFIDTIIRAGHLFLTKIYQGSPYPFIPGKEASGIVVATGKNVKQVKVGDRVAFCSAMRGTYAEYVALPAREVVRIPDSLSFEMAAACLSQGLTACYLAYKTFPLKPGDYALVHAGAGGVGLLLIQLAKHLQATVITTVSTEEKAKLVKEFGADFAVIYTKESFLDAVNTISNNRGVNVVYDSVGKTTFDDSLKSLSARGLLVSFGQSSGPIEPLDINRLAEKSLFLTRPALIHYIGTESALHEMSKLLFELIEKGILKITIGKKYALKDAALAHRDLESRSTIGKLILVPE